MNIEIIHCPTWGSYQPKAVSFAAAIEKASGQTVNISTGKRGQFDVLVDGKIVIKREGGFFKKVILRGGWPTTEEVVQAVTKNLKV